MNKSPDQETTGRTYERAVRKPMSEANRQKMEAAIVADPGRAPLLRGTGGISKLRWAGSGRVEEALGEVLAHVRGEVALPCRIVDDPAAEHILALRKRLKLSRQKFADRFGLDARAVQDWEQRRRVPDRAARVLLTVIDRDPEAVVRVLSK